MAEIFIVSESRDHIEPSGEDTPSEYATAEEAGEAIKKDYHGDLGTRYVLKVTLETVAEYSRPWTLVRKDGRRG